MCACVRERLAQQREELLAEEKQALAVERLKLRQRIIKEETAAVRKRLEEEEEEGVDAMRQQIRDELRKDIKAEEEARLAEDAEVKRLMLQHGIEHVRGGVSSQGADAQGRSVRRQLAAGLQYSSCP